MGFYYGIEINLEDFGQEYMLDLWYRDSGITLLEAVEEALTYSGKYVTRTTNDMEEQALMIDMYHNNDQLQVVIMEDKNLGLCINTGYPVNTAHLTNNDIDEILQKTNAQCEIGMVGYNKELSIFMYMVIFPVKAFEANGINIELLLHDASVATSHILDYMNELRKEYAMHA